MLDFEGRVLLPSGAVSLHGRDGLTVAGNSVIDVSGQVVSLADQLAAWLAPRAAEAHGDRGRKGVP